MDIFWNFNGSIKAWGFGVLGLIYLRKFSIFFRKNAIYLHTPVHPTEGLNPWFNGEINKYDPQ